MITKEQRELRKKYLGSSDLPSVLGMDSWRTIGDVWLEKTGRVVVDEKESVAQDFGTTFEGAVLDHFEKKQGVTLERHLFFTNGVFCSNLDGLIDGSSPEIVEAKTSGSNEAWGPAGTDEIPERVLVQVHEQMYVVSKATQKECRIAWVPVLVPAFRHFEVRIYQIKRSDVLMDSAIRIGDQFWKNHVLTDIPPESFVPSLDVLKRTRRIPEKTVTIADQLVLDWADASIQLSAAKKRADEAQAAVLAAMLDAEGAEWSGGTLTYFEQSRKGYTVEPTSYRVLRRVKGKTL
jgi:predicted phage-related endonuclease